MKEGVSLFCVVSEKNEWASNSSGDITIFSTNTENVILRHCLVLTL